MIKIGTRRSDGRLVRILNAKGKKLRVMVLGGKNADWVNKNDVAVIKQPEPGVHLRMVKSANFDQDCGCTAVVEVRRDRIETFNVYGDIAKYLKSRIRQELDDTPHRRRVFLKENGFVRARGLTHGTTKTDDKFSRIRRFERKGYEVLI